MTVSIMNEYVMWAKLPHTFKYKAAKYQSFINFYGSCLCEWYQGLSKSFANIDLKVHMENFNV